jgi:hypothetical protein
MIFSRIYLIRSTKNTISYQRLLQAHKLDSYLVSTVTSNSWSDGIPLLLWCFQHFLPRLAQVFFTPFYYIHEINVPSTWGVGRCKPLTPTTLIPFSLARNNIFVCRFYSCLQSAISTFSFKFQIPVSLLLKVLTCELLFIFLVVTICSPLYTHQ